MTRDDLLALLAEALPHVRDDDLASRIEAAVSESDDEEEGYERLPTWLESLHVGDLMTMTGEEAAQLDLEGVPANVVLAAVEERIDRLGHTGWGSRIAYPIEVWLKEGAPRASRKKRARKESPVRPEVASFRDAVVKLWRLKKRGATATVLPSIIQEHDGDKDPAGTFALQRILDLLRGDGLDVGPVKTQTGRHKVSWIDVGDIHTGTLLYLPETGAFMFDIPFKQLNGA